VQVEAEDAAPVKSCLLEHSCNAGKSLREDAMEARGWLGWLPWPLGGGGAASCEGLTPVGTLDQSLTPEEARARAETQRAMEKGERLPSPSAAVQLEAEKARQSEVAAKLRSSAVKRGNPGPFDRADQESKRLLNPDWWDGFRMVVNKPLSQRFSSSHEFLLGSSTTESGNAFHFGVNCSPVDETMLMARMDPSGQLDAQWHQTIHPKLLSRIVASLSPESEKSVMQADLEYKGSDFTSTLKLSQGPYIGISYFQSITSRLAMGGEGFYTHAQGAGHIVARAKFTDDDQIATATLTTLNTASANYVRKVNERVNLAAELEVNLSNLESIANIGWEFALRQSRVSGTFDGKVITGQLVQMIDPSVSLYFNAMLDHSRDKHRFGYGVQIG